jgi:hypothetical protein
MINSENRIYLLLLRAIRTGMTIYLEKNRPHVFHEFSFVFHVLIQLTVAVNVAVNVKSFNRPDKYHVVKRSI